MQDELSFYYTESVSPRNMPLVAKKRRETVIKLTSAVMPHRMGDRWLHKRARMRFLTKMHKARGSEIDMLKHMYEQTNKNPPKGSFQGV